MISTPHRALGGRLLRAYVAVLLVALLLFAIFAVVAIDRALRGSLDRGLTTTAQASAVFMDVTGGHVLIDPDDRRQFLDLLNVQADGAIFNARGRLLLSNVARLPQAVANPALSNSPERYLSAGRGDAAFRAYVLPVSHAGMRVGTVVIWRSSDWIDELDRSTIVAFGIAGLLITGVALIFGSAVTRRALEDAFERQRRFTADASHELRAPLAVIRAEADLALRRERSGESYRDALGTIAVEADRIETLIDELLAAARAEAGTLRREPVDLAVLCARVAERMQSMALAKTIDLHLDGDVHVEVFADRAALERALLAIVHNAIKYGRGGGHVTIRVSADAQYAHIDISDDGPGFSPSALEHALERFWRDDASRSADGTGLGLAIARSTIEACDGTLAIANRPGGGALVRCRLRRS